MTLFDLYSSPWPIKVIPIVTHILIAARLSVAQAWKNPLTPTLSAVISSINDQCCMEFLFAKAHMAREKNTKHCSLWLIDPPKHFASMTRTFLLSDKKNPI